MSLGRTLVTGAAGFIGRAVCESLAAEGNVVALVRRTVPTLQVEQRRVADLTDVEGMARAMEGIESVIHLAGRAHVMRERASDPLDAFRRVNVEGTRCVLEQAEKAGVRRLVLASSVKVMGESSPRPFSEEDAPAPTDPYGQSKLEAERLVVGTPRRMHCTALRLPLVYGPGVKANMLALFRWIDRGVPLPFGGIDNQRSMVGLGNLVAALKVVLEAPAANQRALFVSDGKDVSTPQLIQEIARALGREPRLLHVPRSLLSFAGKAGDVMNRAVRFPVSSQALARLFGSLTVDVSALRGLGYDPPVTLAEELDATAKWYRSTK